ncbi:MAG: DUF262 domain-containing protein [Pirellulales bacterium]
MQFLDASREGLAHILADNDLFVPPYQRSYAWKADQVSSLLEDLAGAIRRAPDKGTSEYFLGSVVAIGRDGRLEIVDGQQRLATVSIILAAIRNQFLDVGDVDMAENIERQYLLRFDMETREYPARLTLNEVDNPFYQGWIVSRPDDRSPDITAQSPSHKKIKRAHEVSKKYFQNVWEQYAPSDASRALADWINFLRDHAQVIRVTVQDAADAFIIFETLNDRGLELSTADLLKNYLFGKSGDRLDETRGCWQRMEGALATISSKDPTAEYVRQLWGSYYGLTRKRELFHKIKDEIANKRAAVEFAMRLVEHATQYAAILNPDHELWNSFGAATRNGLRTLKTLKVERLRPLLLSVLSKFPENEVKKTVKWLVAATVRLNAAGGGSSGPTERALAECAVKVREEKIKNLKELAAALVDEHSVIPRDDAFRHYFTGLRVRDAKVARFYLRALEEAFIDSQEPYMLSDDEAVLNLEHVLPQGGRSDHWAHIPDAMANSLYSRLGNMVLLNPKVNAELRSTSFAEKIKAYKVSNSTRLTLDLVEKYGSGSWGDEQINDRQEFLADLAVKAWSIEPK